VLAIRFNPDTKQRSLDTLLWGLVPYWSKDDKTGFINARAERIDTAPAFRRPFQKRRCLIPADGFYEWKKTPEGSSVVRGRPIDMRVVVALPEHVLASLPTLPKGSNKNLWSGNGQ
jgi:putative SOS response-associated peptidase YedK